MLAGQILKYHRFTPSGYKDIGIRTFEFVAKIQFLFVYFIEYNENECCLAAFFVILVVMSMDISFFSNIVLNEPGLGT